MRIYSTAGLVSGGEKLLVPKSCQQGRDHPCLWVLVPCWCQGTMVRNQLVGDCSFNTTDFKVLMHVWGTYVSLVWNTVSFDCVGSVCVSRNSIRCMLLNMSRLHSCSNKLVKYPTSLAVLLNNVKWVFRPPNTTNNFTHDQK